MTLVLRVFAIAIAVAALVDPALAVRQRTPLALEFVLPAPSDPTHAAALARARELEALLDGIATSASADPAAVRVVLGNGDIPTDLTVPVYFVASGTDRPQVLITAVDAGGEVVPGQALGVTAAVRGDGLAGRRSTIALLDRGVEIAQTEHTWRSDADRFVARLRYVPSRAGAHPLTVHVRTADVETATASTAAVAVDRPLRVLVYEPRPSWAAAFVRRSLERDPAFALAALSRSGRALATRAGAAPRSIESLDASAFDVVVVGAPDALTANELTSLDRFASERGGALLLVPDRRLTPAVQEKFALPPMEELLLEKTVPVRAGAITVPASELLLPHHGVPGPYSSLAAVEISSIERAAVIAVARGEGTVVVSGLLDAWRHRQSSERAADAFWRGLVADLAVAAPRRLHVSLDPVVARPGDRVKVRITWRRDAMVRSGEVEVPATSAFRTVAVGAKEMVRLWPGDRAGVFEAMILAPAAGLHTITAAANGTTADAILRVEEQVVHASGDRAGAAAQFATAASGGAVVRDGDELAQRLRAIDAPEVELSAYPMRSPLWILPFAGCLCAEWFVRRRRGLR